MDVMKNDKANEIHQRSFLRDFSYFSCGTFMDKQLETQQMVFNSEVSQRGEMMK